MDVSYYDSPLESLNLSDTGETKKKKDLFIHSFIQQISIESLRLTLTELGAGDDWPSLSWELAICVPTLIKLRVW